MDLHWKVSYRLAVARPPFEFDHSTQQLLYFCELAEFVKREKRVLLGSD